MKAVEVTAIQSLQDQKSSFLKFRTYSPKKYRRLLRLGLWKKRQEGSKWTPTHQGSALTKVMQL